MLGESRCRRRATSPRRRRGSSARSTCAATLKTSAAKRVSLWWLGRCELLSGDLEAARVRLNGALRAFHAFEMYEELLGCLDDHAELMRAMDAAHDAVRVYAGVEVARERLTLRRYPRGQRRWCETIAEARRHLGDAAFEQAWSQGRGLDARGRDRTREPARRKRRDRIREHHVTQRQRPLERGRVEGRPPEGGHPCRNGQRPLERLRRTIQPAVIATIRSATVARLGNRVNVTVATSDVSSVLGARGGRRRCRSATWQSRDEILAGAPVWNRLQPQRSSGRIAHVRARSDELRSDVERVDGAERAVLDMT